MKTRRWSIPDHPRYSFTSDARVFGPRGHELRQTLIRGLPAITVTNPKRTIYLAKMAAQVWFGPIADDEELAYVDGDKTNWQLPNLIIKAQLPWWWSDVPTALEVEYEQIRGIERLMQPPSWYVKRRRRDLGHGPDQ